MLLAQTLGMSPPDSPIPQVSTFNLDDEFFAIVSSDGEHLLLTDEHSINFFNCLEAPKKLIYFVGLVDTLTHYGVKKRTASAAKSGTLRS